jgi:mannose-6-phosphate isomerase-like protein (cupin superfamily)
VVYRTGDSKGITMAGAREAFVLAPGEGRSIDLGGFGMTVEASADATDGVFSLLEAAEPPEFGPPLHIHHDAAEAFYVLEGEYVMFLDDREVSCPAACSSTSLRECPTASGSARHRVARSISTSRR